LLSCVHATELYSSIKLIFIALNVVMYGDVNSAILYLLTFVIVSVNKIIFGIDFGVCFET